MDANQVERIREDARNNFNHAVEIMDAALTDYANLIDVLREDIARRDVEIQRLNQRLIEGESDE